MIRFKVKVIYRDDKENTFDCSDHPSIGERYLTLYHDSNMRSYLPQEAIKNIKVTDYWKI